MYISNNFLSIHFLVYILFFYIKSNIKYLGTSTLRFDFKSFYLSGTYLFNGLFLVS